MMDDPQATYAASLDAWEGFPASAQPAHLLDETLAAAPFPTPSPTTKSEWPALNVDSVAALGTVQGDVLPTSRIMLASSAILGASLAAAGGAGVLMGQYLFALVNTKTVHGSTALNVNHAAGLLSVGGVVMLMGALACAGLAVTAVAAGTVAQKMAPPVEPETAQAAPQK